MIALLLILLMVELSKNGIHFTVGTWIIFSFVVIDSLFDFFKQIAEMLYPKKDETSNAGNFCNTKRT